MHKLASRKKDKKLTNKLILTDWQVRLLRQFVSLRIVLGLFYFEQDCPPGLSRKEVRCLGILTLLRLCTKEVYGVQVSESSKIISPASV